MIRLFLALLLAFAAPVVSLAQPQPAAQALWRASGDRTTFTTAGFSFPRQIGSLQLTEAQEFSHQGQGIDNGLKYASRDREVFATVYIYLPGLAHGGLTDFMTDQAIRQQSEPEIRTMTRGPAAVGGQADRAIRADYSGYLHNLASSAAYIKAGRWIVKIRVSGPGTRRVEVEAAMTALLNGIRFEGRLQPWPASPFDITDCAGPPPAAAHSLPADPAQVMEGAVFATLDAAGEVARNDPEGAPVLVQIGTQWCVSTRIRLGQSTFPVLRAMPLSGSQGVPGPSVLLVPMTDAGRTLQLVQRNGRYTLLHHNIGVSHVLGSYDATLSDDQVRDILSGADQPGTRIRATVEHRADGNTNIILSTPAEGAQQPTAGTRPPTT